MPCWERNTSFDLWWKLFVPCWTRPFVCRVCFFSFLQKQYVEPCTPTNVHHICYINKTCFLTHTYLRMSYKAVVKELIFQRACVTFRKGVGDHQTGTECSLLTCSSGCLCKQVCVCIKCALCLNMGKNSLFFLYAHWSTWLLASRRSECLCFLWICCTGFCHLFIWLKKQASRVQYVSGQVTQNFLQMFKLFCVYLAVQLEIFSSSP